MIYTAVGKPCAVESAGNTSGLNERAPQLFSSEEELEQHINAAYERMCAANDRTMKLQYWREMCRLIDKRTPHRVRFMERMAGLR